MSKNPLRYFKISPEIIRLAVLMHVRFPLSHRNVEDMLHERGIEFRRQSVCLWGDQFGIYLALKIRKRRSESMSEVHNGSGTPGRSVCEDQR